MTDSKRLDTQREKAAGFEATTGKSSFSPSLTSRLSEIRNWIEQGKDIEYLVGRLKVSREEVADFLRRNNLEVKRIKSKAADFGGWGKAAE